MDETRLEHSIYFLIDYILEINTIRLHVAMLRFPESVDRHQQLASMLNVLRHKFHQILQIFRADLWFPRIMDSSMSVICLDSDFFSSRTLTSRSRLLEGCDHIWCLPRRGRKMHWRWNSSPQEICILGCLVIAKERSYPWALDHYGEFLPRSFHASKMWEPMTVTRGMW